jgi:hypothetical protein
MDPFTNATGVYQRAKNLRATPYPITAGEVFEYAAPPSIGNLLKNLVGIVAFLIAAGCLLAFVGENLRG